MTVTFDITEDDLDAKQTFIKRRLWEIAGVKVYGVLTITLPCFFLGFGYSALLLFYRRYQGVLTLHLQLSLGAMITGIILYIFFSRLFKYRLKKFLQSESGVAVGTNKVELTIDGLHELTSVNETRRKWQGILGVEMNSEYIGIFTDNASCIWIPKRAFSSEVEVNNFISEIEKHCQAAIG